MVDPHPKMIHFVRTSLAPTFRWAAFCLCAVLGFAAEARKNFNLPAGEAEQTLRQFSTQSGVQVIFPTREVTGIRTNSVKGELSTEEALDAMLVGTRLVAVRDPKTGTLTIRREATLTDAEKNVASRRAEAAAANGAATRATDGVRDGVVEMDRYEVTGSRIRRDPQEMGANPVFVYTRAEIERSGALSIADFTNRLPQNTDDLAGLNTGFVTSATGARTTVNLRGLGNGTTLILINGRRLPKTGQGFNTDNYDLSSIPLAAVERIEVLTDGASAIYGSDAIAGVINIITRRDFSGTEVALQYGNTFHTDAGEVGVSVSTGFAREKFSAFLSATYRKRNSFGNDARPYTATANFRSSGGRDGRFDYYGGAGTVTTDSFDPLPGLETETAGIPPNQNGRALTPADFVPFDGVSERLDWAPYLDSAVASTLESVRGSFEYDLSPRLKPFFDAAFSLDRNIHRGPPPTTSIFVPGDNPFNPFGVDVWVDKTFYELGRSRAEFESRNVQLTAGARGELFGDWRYEAAGSYVRNAADTTTPLPDWLGDTLTPFIETTDASRAVNLFGDGRTTQPNSAGLLESAIGLRDYTEVSEVSGFDVRADGTVLQLPTGDLRLALGAEYREEKIAFAENDTTGAGFIGVDTNVDRQNSSAYAELLVPLVQPARALPLVHSFELQLAGRLDRYPGFGEQFSPKFSARWRPFKSLMLRGSFGEGFKVPNLYSLERPFATNNLRLSPSRPFTDPVRGDPITQFVLVTQGGNPGLLAERSESTSFGFVYAPTFASGLSVSADYFHVDFQDKVVHFVAALDVLTYFPGRITRGAPTAADTAAGLPGRITALDLRAVNMARSETRGVDVSVMYDRATDAGHWTLRLEGTRMFSFEDQATLSAPRRERAGTLIYPKWRANASLFWKKDPYEAGIRARYIHDSAQAFTGLIPSFPARIDAAQEYDLFVAYDFGTHGEGTSRWRNYLRNTRVSVDIINVLDTEPPNTNGAGGYAHLDPRQRRFTLTLRKTF